MMISEGNVITGVQSKLNMLIDVSKTINTIKTLLKHYTKGAVLFFPHLVPNKHVLYPSSK